jgi:hypothetical protein
MAATEKSNAVETPCVATLASRVEIDVRQFPFAAAAVLRRRPMIACLCGPEYCPDRDQKRIDLGQKGVGAFLPGRAR